MRLPAEVKSASPRHVWGAGGLSPLRPWVRLVQRSGSRPGCPRRRRPGRRARCSARRARVIIGDAKPPRRGERSGTRRARRLTHPFEEVGQRDAGGVEVQPARQKRKARVGARAFQGEAVEPVVSHAPLPAAKFSARPRWGGGRRSRGTLRLVRGYVHRLPDVRSRTGVLREGVPRRGTPRDQRTSPGQRCRTRRPSRSHAPLP